MFNNQELQQQIDLLCGLNSTTTTTAKTVCGGMDELTGKMFRFLKQKYIYYPRRKKTVNPRLTSFKIDEIKDH